MSWTLTIVENGWPRPDVAVRHVKEGRYHLTLGLFGDGPRPEEAADQVIADARAMLDAVLSEDQTALDLVRKLREAQAQRTDPAGTLANAERVLGEVAARRAEPALLQAGNLGEVLQDLDRKETTARAHQAQAQTVLAGIDAQLAQTRRALADRRRVVAGLCLDQIRADVAKERELVAAAFIRAAERELGIMARVEAEARAAAQPEALLERVLSADQTAVV